MSETEKQEKTSKVSQVKVYTGNQSQYIPDRTLRRMAIDKAEDSESKKK